MFSRRGGSDANVAWRPFGGFLASAAAMQRFTSVPPFASAISAGFRFAAAPTASTWSGSCQLRRLEHHSQSVARLRDRPHLPVRGGARLQRDAEVLQEMPGEAFRLHIGEVQPDAHMRAAAERHPGKAMAAALRLVG